MHVVANRRAVGRRVVGAHHLERPAGAECRADRERQRVRFRFVAFADLAVRVRAGRVEVAQRDHFSPYARSKSAAIRSIAYFVKPYGLIGCCGVRSEIGSPSGMPYVAHDDDITILPTPAACIALSSVQVPVTLTVIAVGREHRIADVRERGEMDHDIGPMRGERLRQRVAVEKVGRDERPQRTASRWPVDRLS